MPDAIRERGYVVRTLYEVYGAQLEQGLPDPTYLRDAGRQGWVVLSADATYRRRPAEAAAIVDGSTRVFALARGDRPGAEQVAHFIDNLDAILRACSRPGPAIYAVLRDRIERRWP